MIKCPRASGSGGPPEGRNDLSLYPS